jgi:hypothetical protein
LYSLLPAPLLVETTGSFVSGIVVMKTGQTVMEDNMTVTTEHQVAMISNIATTKLQKGEVDTAILTVIDGPHIRCESA